MAAVSARPRGLAVALALLALLTLATAVAGQATMCARPPRCALSACEPGSARGWRGSGWPLLLGMLHDPCTPPLPHPPRARPYTMTLLDGEDAGVAAGLGDGWSCVSPCSFTWLLQCPNAGPQRIEGNAPGIVASLGPGTDDYTVDIIMAGVNRGNAITCALELTVTSMDNETDTAATTVTVK